MRKKKLIVFVKNKLITIDTVLPILLEMKMRYSIPSEIVVFDQMAHEGISKNVVIRDLIKYVGKETFINKWKAAIIFDRIYKLFTLFRLLLHMINGAKIIHFGHLNIWPLKIFALLFNSRIFQMQSDSYNFNFKGIEHGVYPPPVGLNIVFFYKNIKNTIFSQVGNEKKLYSFGETRTRKIWVHYMNSKSNYYLNKYHKDIDFSKGAIVFILGAIDAYPHKKALFHKTIESLSVLDSKIPVLLKPHTYTEIDTVTSAISDDSNFHITYLHPSILCTIAKVFIGNNFSNTFADAHSFGVPTIEYSHYDKETIKRTKGHSIDEQFVTYFNNNNNKKFVQTIEHVVLQKYTKKIFKGYDSGDNGLFTALGGTVEL